jgi:hypothetical protein
VNTVSHGPNTSNKLRSCSIVISHHVAIRDRILAQTSASCLEDIGFQEIELHGTRGESDKASSELSM